MNAGLVSRAADLIFRAMGTRQTAAGIAAALDAAGMLQSPETAAKTERDRECLRALRADALNMRGTLSPEGRPRRVPMPLGESLTPVVEWLLDEVDRLRAQVAGLQPEEPQHPAPCGWPASPNCTCVKVRPAIAHLPEPYACAVCGLYSAIYHGMQYGADGMHRWTAPTDEQIKARMQARRAERLAARGDCP